MDLIRWGVLGPGNIARTFARGLSALDDHIVVAAGSRDEARAQAFTDRHGTSTGIGYGSYAALVESPEVDAIYVATPHPFHREHATLALRAGKAVLCEKPLCVNRHQGEALVAASVDSGSFLMEAMWTRFLPAVDQVLAWIQDGAIGDVRMLSCDVGFRCPWRPESRLLDPALAGGALLDVGVYTVAMASLLFGHEPLSTRAQGHIGASGVDEQCALLLRYAGGELAVLRSAIRTNTPHVARIEGTEGCITLPAFWRATTATLERPREKAVTVRAAFTANGYEYEAAEVARCLRAGLIESPRMCHAESLGILTIMDQARAEMGLSYPCEAGDTL